MIRINLQYLSAVRATGADAASFLQAQLTADLTRLADGDSGFSAYCDPNGNVLALLRVIRQGDDFLLIAAKALMDTLLATLRKYVLRARVSLEPLDDAVLGIGNGGLGYAIAGAGVSGDEREVAAWRARELRAGIAWLGPHTSGRFLPQMLGFDRLGAVSFRKGCFPGQEVIARLRYLAKPKRLPLLAEIRGTVELAPGEEVELHGEDGLAGSAVVVDSAVSGGATGCFLVARIPDNRPVIAIETGGNRFELSELVQTWATM